MSKIIIFLRFITFFILSYSTFKYSIAMLIIFIDIIVRIIDKRLLLSNS